MASENEPAKLLLPYLQRADELQKHEPLVAYYCRLYAMERGLRIPQKERTKTTNALLVSLINQLEKDRKSLTLGPDDYLHVEGFASNVFSKADKQDRAGRANLNTAKTFYAASIFFEILNQFGEIQPDLEQKQKYAVWKAADIRKALKEGRKPVPGPPGGDEDLSVPSSAPSGGYDLEPSRSDSTTRFDSSRTDPSTPIPPDSNSSPQPYDKLNSQYPTDNISQPSNVTNSPFTIPPSPPHYPTNEYPSHNFQQAPENFHQPQPPDNIHPQQYKPELPHHLPQHYIPQDMAPPYSYPNFQSYPSFSESTLPAAPSNHPSFYQGPDASYSNSSPAGAASYPSAVQYAPANRNGNVPEASQTTMPKYEYDSNYQPPPEQIAEAHKAARFAVGALAFDDVSVAVEHLKKSLELLTRPSARR
ncbi:Protein HOMOLOG OF MAMMALIAN LYST-INTERACTING PROTEIN 5 [Striga hermonthica]|uniref:Protein HOMOLOG OF MAMMALIAN LYST-INTERACTING PROTEIN 5 n=1 Tax=Striga hermonthica TaxID=68872 RepID=A0A9N7NND3_STRHE|nr:Protein HOMOLOG OF MAMMALIAN LYST-INTERACTING PROTEIN 5 [Striga hermonthica]